MRDIDKIKERYGNRGGWTVPEGYFENLYAELEKKLPEYRQAPKAPDLSLWQRVKPYVYMAAMFAGIWLMMKVFHNVSAPGELSLDNPPAQIALAMQNSDVSGDAYFFTMPALHDIQLEEDILSDYKSFEEFERDFNSEPSGSEERMNN